MMNETYPNESNAGTESATPMGTTEKMGTTGQQSTTVSGANVTSSLYRHPTEKLVGGVCGGLADYLGWDAALLRIVWLVATLVTGGGGLLAYLVLWGLLPVGTKAGGVQQSAAFDLNERNIGRIATVLIGLGLLWLLSNLGILPRMWSILSFTIGVIFWPALLIGIGYLLLRGSGNANVDLNIDLGNLRRNVQSRMSGVKLPRGNGFKSSLSQGRANLPFRRSSSDKLFLGVCGGIGQRVGIDANLVRLLWAAFSIGSIGMGVLLYVALGLLLPEERPTNEQSSTAQDVEIVDGTKPHTV